MAIILYHTNTTIPDHLKDCVAKIRQYSNIPIYLLTDCDYNIATVKVVNINKYNEFKWLQDLDYFRGICALSIMIYHYSWFVLGQKYTSDNFHNYCCNLLNIMYHIANIYLFQVKSQIIIMLIS